MALFRLTDKGEVGVGFSIHFHLKVKSIEMGIVKSLIECS